MRRCFKQDRVAARHYGGKYPIQRDQILMLRFNYDPRSDQKRSSR